MAYHSHPGEGYETGPSRIGLAWTKDENLMTWQQLPDPVLIPEDGAAGERAGLYKECLVHHDGVFYLFYNAKNQAQSWIEQTGVATSPDLVTWIRHPGNPVLRVSPGSWDSWTRFEHPGWNEGFHSLSVGYLGTGRGFFG